jgi:putative SOS response-associated peptidase YedK
MCGRYALYAGPARMRRVFELSETPRDLVPHFNIAPSQDVPVVRAGEAGNTLTMLRWGLMPPWSEGPKGGARMINARAETVHERPAFRAALARRRCLVPADGFYEWRKDAGGKTPHFCRLKAEGPFAFAGLWETWRDTGKREGETGAVIESVTILTTAANALMAPIHDRMPVILRPADHAGWLDPSVPGAEAVARVAAPFPPEAMEVFAVGPAVNNPRHDGPELIRPA